MAAAAQPVHRRTAGVELQHLVAIGDGLVERLLDEELGGAIGVDLHVVGLQANGGVEVVEGPDAVAEFEVGIGAIAVRRRDIGPQADGPRKALHRLAVVAGGIGLVPAAEQVLGVVGVPVAGHVKDGLGLVSSGRGYHQDGLRARLVRVS